MGILGNSNSLASDIDKATSETNTQEKWGLIMDVCDKVTNGAVNSKECLKVIVKRLNHSDPHVVMQAITLLDACVSNCGKQFHLEVASREFETEFRKLLQKSQPKVNTRLKLCLKKWAESEFKSDPQLNLIPSLYMKLRADGHDFSDPSVTPKREVPLSKDPNVVSSQQEEEDIAKAIELSLKENKSSAGTSGSQSPKMASNGAAAASSSLYPSLLSSTTSSAPPAEPRKVRALYDFEAAEDNEMTFHAGEVLMVLDDSDPNWWKGENHRGEGLFPSNFVTSDLNAEPEGASSKTKKNVQFSDEQKKDDEEEETAKEQVVEINEEKIDRLLHLLHEADPEDPSADSEEMLQLEQMVNQMGPLIDTELERVDRKHAQLTQLSSDLVEAINLYHTLMREPDRSMMMGSSGYGIGGFPGQAPMPGMYGVPGMYGPSMPGMFPGMGGMPGGMLPYGMGQLRHDMGQMSVSSIPQFPPPQQAMPTMSQNGPSSLPPHQIPTGGVLGQQQVAAGQPPMHQHMPPQPGTQQPQPTQSQHMPNMTIQQQPTTSAAPHMMNMGHIQSPLPQNFPNPTSPPPVISSAPSSLPQQQQTPAVTNQPIPRPPIQHQQQPVGAPVGSFPPYGAVPPPQQQQHHQAPQNGPIPPPSQQHPQPPTATAPPPNNMNHHPHPAQMPPVAPYQTTSLPPYMQMPPGGTPGGFPHHHMLGHMMAPPGSPLSINTASNSPQNIPIYQQQR